LSVTITILCLLIVPAWFLGYVGSRIGPQFTFAGQLVGVILGVIVLMVTAEHYLFIFVEEWSAFVSQDLIDGSMVPYGPGMHCTHWWEARNKKGKYDLDAQSGEIKLSCSTTTSSVEVSGVFEFAISLAYISKAIGVKTKNAVEKVIRTFVERFVTSWCASKPADYVRQHIDELNDDLAARFMSELATSSGSATDLESSYGYIAVSMSIGKVDLPPAAQKTRDAIDEAEKLREVIAKMYGLTVEQLAAQLSSGQISQERFQVMIDNALVTSDNATTKTVHAFEVNAPEIAAVLRAILGKGK